MIKGPLQVIPTLKNVDDILSLETRFGRRIDPIVASDGGMPLHTNSRVNDRDEAETRTFRIGLKRVRTRFTSFDNRSLVN